MPLFKRIASSTLALLLLAALPAFSAEPAKDAPKDAVKAEAKETPKAAAKEAAKTSPTDTLVKVNGTAITRGERDRAVKVLLAQNRMSEPLPDETMQRAQEAALEQLTAAELLYQAALKVPVKDLDKQVADRMAKNRAKFESEADFEGALKEVDMTVKDMQNFTRKDIIIANFIEQEFSAKTVVTDAEAKAFYDENLEKYFKKPERVRASHILISADSKASDEEKKKAKEKAEALLKRVKAGEDFAALAKAESSCPSAAQGGDLGSFGKGEMVPPFENAAFGMKVGEVSGIVETQFGYHIIKVTDKEEASTDKFEDVKGKINDFLKRDKTQKAITAFVDDLKKVAKIEKL